MSAAQPAGGPGFGAARLAEETRERFLREIVARVPVERIVEVHCFPPIRQGGVETGVAVVAAVQLPTEECEAPATATAVTADAAAPDAASTETAFAEAASSEDASSVDAPTEAAAADETPAAPAEDVVDADAAAEGAADAVDQTECDPTDDAAGPPPAETAADDDAPVAADAVAVQEPSVAASATAEGVTWSDAAEEPPLESASMEEVLSEDVPVDVETPPPPRVGPRHTVFTARYRLTLKGPDRGRWQMDVVEEADAPLVTVEAVVRGVQRRAGDAADSERLAAADVAAIVARAPAAPPSPSARGGSTR